VPKQVKKSTLDVGYLRTATSKTLASSIFTAGVNEEQQRLIHEKQPEQIAIELLQNNPYQPRQVLEETSLQQLAETISSQGFQGVLIARPHPQQSGLYQITAGHRRREAAKKAGLQTLPIIVHSWSDQDMAALAATENIQREDLSPLEEGKLFLLMIDELKLTQVEVANAIKKDRGYVRNRLRLATAPPDIQTFISAKTDSMRAVIYLLDIEDPEERAPIIERLLQRTLTTDDLPAYIEEIRRRKHSTPLTQPTSITPPTLITPPPTLAPHAPQPISAQPPARVREEQAEASRDVRTTSASSPQPAQPSSPETSGEPERRLSTQMRARQTRLRAIHRQLLDYQKLLEEQEERPTTEERALLRKIHEIVRQLAQMEGKKD
jgi:ParB family chromosome partitioning protein